jgi:acylphosphatase
MMLRAKVVIVKGRVQRVGYRRYVLDAAQEEGVAGYVRDQPDGSVRIFAQGEGGHLSSFMKRIQSPPPPALVREVQERRAKPSKSKAFRVISKGLAEEIQEGFGAMQAEFRDYRSEFRDYRGEFRGFASRTDGSFATMNQKYGEISEKLSAIMAQLADQLQSMRADAKETSMTLNESLKLLKEAVERLPKQN